MVQMFFFPLWTLSCAAGESLLNELNCEDVIIPVDRYMVHQQCKFKTDHQCNQSFINIYITLRQTAAHSLVISRLQHMLSEVDAMRNYCFFLLLFLLSYVSIIQIQFERAVTA